MCFGHLNALGTLQRTTDVILSSVRWQFTLVNFADTMIVNRAPKQKAKHLKKILSLLNSARVNHKQYKCSFSTDTNGYLGT